MGPDEIDCGNLFDQIDDLIEFPLENESDGHLIGSSNGKDFFPAWKNDGSPDCDLFLSGGHVDPTSDLSAELSVPYEDIMQLEWLSTFVEDCFSGRGLTLPKDSYTGPTNGPSPAHQFQSSSPVSVLESSSSSSSSGKTGPPLGPNQCSPQRARSKRPRPSTFNPRPSIQLVSPSSSSVGPTAYGPLSTARAFPESDNFAESPPAKKARQQPADKEPKKSKKTKPTPLAGLHEDGPAQAPPVRKCLHCEITKTPQWRAGPMGPKTLCNACGVRYKSGRLFPEYRPAASPTFVPAIHSNSHKKVLEMRGKGGPPNVGPEGPEVIAGPKA